METDKYIDIDNKMLTGYDSDIFKLDVGPINTRYIVKYAKFRVSLKYYSENSIIAKNVPKDGIKFKLLDGSTISWGFNDINERDQVYDKLRAVLGDILVF